MALKSSKIHREYLRIHNFEASHVYDVDICYSSCPWGHDCERCPWCELPLTMECQLQATRACLQNYQPWNASNNDPFPRKKTTLSPLSWLIVILKTGYKHFALTRGGLGLLSSGVFFSNRPTSEAPTIQEFPGSPACDGRCSHEQNFGATKFQGLQGFLKK